MVSGKTLVKRVVEVLSLANHEDSELILGNVVNVGDAVLVPDVVKVI